MSDALTPLSCNACGAAVPLPDTLDHGTTTRCSHCQQAVPIGAEYVAAIRAISDTAAARRAAEPLWRALSNPPSPVTAVVALGLVVLLPVVATLIAALVPFPPLGRVEIYATVTIPALLPGATLYLWTAASSATTMRFRDALSAHPPRRNSKLPSCRQCGAPVSVAPEAIATTCAYCGTDNLVTNVPQRGLQRRLAEATRTLDDALAKLRLRRIMLAFGALGITALAAGASFLLWLALGA